MSPPQGPMEVAYLAAIPEEETVVSFYDRMTDLGNSSGEAVMMVAHRFDLSTNDVRAALRASDRFAVTYLGRALKGQEPA